MAASDLLLWVGGSWGWDSPYRAMNIDFTSLLPLIFIWRMENWSICFQPCRQAAFSNSASVLWTGGKGVRMGLRIAERILGSLLGAVGTNLFLNKEPTASLPSGLGLSNVMALYLHFLIIWNNNEFSAPAKNSDWVQARGAVDQCESFLSFMWTWKKRIKVFEVREKYMTECASNTKLSEDIWKDDGYFISVLFYNKALSPATGALDGLIIHTHICLALEDTRPRGKREIPRCLRGDLVLHSSRPRQLPKCDRACIPYYVFIFSL